MRSVRIQPDEYKKRVHGSIHVRVPAGMKVSWLHFSAFALVLAVAALAAGCAKAPVRGASHAAAKQPLATLDLPAESANGKASALLI